MEFIFLILPIVLIIMIVYLMYKEKDIIKFKNLELPNTPYLKGKYITGLDYKSGNMYLTLDKDNIKIAIENKDGIFYEEITNVKEIKVNIKPFNYVKEVAADYEPNHTKTNGRNTGDFSYKNKVIVLKSYELSIITNNKVIELIVFKDPNKFFGR